MAIITPQALLACWPPPSCALTTGLECSRADVLCSAQHRGRSFWVMNILTTEAPEGGQGVSKVASLWECSGMAQTP